MRREWDLAELTSAQLSQLVELEKSSFSDPWSEELLRQELEGELSLCIGLLREGGLAAAACFRIAADEAELLRVAVLPAYRRQGLGKRLLQEGARLLAARRCRLLYLEVRESNAPARALYQSLGFDAVGRRKDYYRSPQEDALLLRCELPPWKPQAAGLL
ncbi:MAG: ribosomal protein S18-alanine N-acetyltransferase [Clostridia bacterium]|nr:ribosomal protein S18-alanine N-acetyltransferase [Clostridia bacterium]